MGRSSRHQFLLGFGLAVLLASCAAATLVETQCLPMVEYTAEQQQQLRAEYSALPHESLLRRVVMDYLALRDANRACQRASKP